MKAKELVCALYFPQKWQANNVSQEYHMHVEIEKEVSKLGDNLQSNLPDGGSPYLQQ